jgi:Uma2 family endonuclease
VLALRLRQPDLIFVAGQEFNEIMAGAPLHVQQRMSVGQFRQFIEGRPDKERWELIDGVAMMMVLPTPAHQRIASNLERLLLDALETHAPALTAFQAIGVNVGPAIEDYDPEPDVVVTDSGVEEAQDERYADRFYLAAEIVSSNERVDIDRKRSIYKLHNACSCILTVQQDRFEVQIDLRTENGWSEQVLTQADDILAIPAFSLRCCVADLYRATPLVPRRPRSS